MTSTLMAMLQGAVEHGALSGGQGAARPRGRGFQDLTELASENATVLVAVAAGLLLLWLLLRGRQRI